MIQNTLGPRSRIRSLDCCRNRVYALPPMSGSKLAARPMLVYRFGPYELDTGGGELRKFGSCVKLGRKPLQLLIALVERAGEVVTRGDLRRLLWGEDLFVDFDRGLNVAVNKLRATLNDSPDKATYIETVAGEGYRFVAEVEEMFAPASPCVQAISQVDTPRPSLVRFPPEQEPQHAVSVGTLPSSLQKWKTWKWVAVVVCAAVIAVAVARLVWQRLREPAPVHAGKIMLVVLPFENLSVDHAGSAQEISGSSQARSKGPRRLSSWPILLEQKNNGWMGKS